MFKDLEIVSYERNQYFWRMLSTWYWTLDLLIESLRAALSEFNLNVWASDSNLDLAKVLETMSARISDSILDLLRTSSLINLSASSSASILDLRNALYLAALLTYTSA